MLSCINPSRTQLDIEETIETSQSLKKRHHPDSESNESTKSSPLKRPFQESQALIPILLEVNPPIPISMIDLTEMVMDLTQAVRDQKQLIQDLERSARDQNHELKELQDTAREQRQEISELQEEVRSLKQSAPIATKVSEEAAAERFNHGSRHEDGRVSHPQATSQSSNGSPIMTTQPPKATEMNSPLPQPHQPTYAQKVRATPSHHHMQSAPSPPLFAPSPPPDGWTTQARRQRNQQHQVRKPQNPLKAKVRSLLPPLPQGEASEVEAHSVPSSEERIQRLLLAEENVPTTASSESATPLPASRQPIPITCVRVKEENFNKACRSAPKEAWRLLLREKARPLQLNWSILDILPISPIMAEIYLPLDQLPSFQSTLGSRIVDPSLYTIQESDFKRRLAAYRMGYFKELRLAALQDLCPILQVRLLREAALTPSTVRTRHRDIQASAKHDLAALGAPLSTPLAPPHQGHPPPEAMEEMDTPPIQQQ